MELGERPPPARRAAAFSVHLFTASGGAVALLALYAAIERDFPLCFAWLGVALFIDGIDGTLARFARVSEIGRDDRRRGSGSRRRFPDLCARARRRALAVRSDAGRGVVLARTARHFRVGALFRGHADEDQRLLVSRFSRAVERGRALSVRASAAGDRVRGSPVLGSAGMFAPIVFVHPMRVQKWRCVNIAACLSFLALSAAAILQDLRVADWVKAGFIVVAVYFLALPFLRHSPWADR